MFTRPLLLMTLFIPFFITFLGCSQGTDSNQNSNIQPDINISAPEKNNPADVGLPSAKFLQNDQKPTPPEDQEKKGEE